MLFSTFIYSFIYPLLNTPSTFNEYDTVLVPRDAMENKHSFAFFWAYIPAEKRDN
jgi:hypothetical protein